MAQMGNVSGGKEMVELTSGGAFCPERQNLLYCAKRRMPCFFSLYLLYWKTPGRGGKTSGQLPVRETLLPAYPAT